VAGGGERILDPLVHEEPCAVVARLFLTPYHVLKVGHALQPHRQRIAREGEQLFDADD